LLNYKKRYILFYLFIIQGEREAKYALKKELDSRVTSDTMYNLSSLALSIGDAMTSDDQGKKNLELDLPA
jgi:hypothetical protein